jgi:hypothetical protein
VEAITGQDVQRSLHERFEQEATGEEFGEVGYFSNDSQFKRWRRELLSELYL